jgi:hypothetical protein
MRPGFPRVRSGETASDTRQHRPNRAFVLRKEIIISSSPTPYFEGLGGNHCADWQQPDLFSTEANAAIRSPR